MTSKKYIESLLNSTCSAQVRLKKGDDEYNGVYNGLSFWGKVFDDDYNIIEELEEETDLEEGVPYNFSEASFNRIAGYQIHHDSNS